MTRSVAALVLGFQALDRRVRIAGVILNRLAGARQEQKIRAALETHTDVPVIGALPRSSEITILERHLGLTTPGETAVADQRIAALAEVVRASIDLDRLRAIAVGAPALPTPPAASPRPQMVWGGPVTIAVARDSAFGFYYPDDIEALERAGARVVPFSPLSDRALPEADACFIGGGFPETHMAALAANTALRSEIRGKAAGGLPIYAECGGLMYLAREIRWGAERAEMCGVIDADVVMHGKPQGRGLVQVAPTAEFPWPVPSGPAPAIAAHEFHYAALTGLPPATRFAWRVLRGHGINGRNDGIVVGNVLASFVHQRDTAANPWAERFVAFVRKVRRERSAPLTRPGLGSDS
jgi:cobyrinic acid a,c-diamide synthase